MNARNEGRAPVLPPVYLLMTVILMIGLHLVFPVRHVIPSRARYWGVAPVLAGLALVMWVAKLFDRAGTTIKPFQESSALVVRGPYRLSRNPIYLGMVVALLGLGMMLGSLAPFAIVPVFGWVIDRRFIRREEAMLERTFGASYAEYKARVRRWL